MGNSELINRVVSENPGISFTGLKERTSLCNGVIQYHVRRSDRIERKKGGLVSVDACEGCRFRERCRDRCIHGILKDERKGEILELLEEGLSQAEIGRRLELDRSTVHYHVEQLREQGLLDD